VADLIELHCGVISDAVTAVMPRLEGRGHARGHAVAVGGKSDAVVTGAKKSKNVCIFIFRTATSLSSNGTQAPF